MRFPIISIGIVTLFLVGCAEMFAPHPKTKTVSLGHIDLSTNGAKCETHFVWPGYYPELTLMFTKTNGATSTDSPLVLQVDVTDRRSGEKIISSQVRRGQMQIWPPPATSVDLTMLEWRDVLQKGHSYKCVLTVTHEVPDAGVAEVRIDWLEGGDSM